MANSTPLRPHVPATTIPAHMGELHTDWLTASLRECGAIGPDNSVEEFQVETLGDGEGFIGELGRLHLRLAADTAGGPRTLIAKTPSRLDKNRGIGVLVNAYENEVRFYRELAETMQIRVPRAYAAAITAEPRSSRIANRVVTRLPGSVTLRLLGTLTKAAARSPRRFALLIEDIHDGVAGDQVAGADHETATVALTALATMHAQHWEQPTLERPWLRASDANRAFAQALYQRAWLTFRARYAAVLPPEMVELGVYLQKHGGALLSRMARSPRTLLHGDYRLDNLLFDREDRTRVTVIDWQRVGAGNGMTDVVYFLRTNLLPELADRMEDDLVRFYHDQLMERGVRGYSLEACLADYRIALAWLLHQGATLIGLLDLSHERGQAVVDRAIERSAPKIAEVTPAELRAAGI